MKIRKVVNYWDISEDLGEVILSVDADELSSVLDVGKGSEIYLIDDGRIVGAENEKLLGRTEDILETKRVSQKSITNTRSGWKIRPEAVPGPQGAGSGSAACFCISDL